MSQEEVLNYLGKQKEPVGLKEIYESMTNNSPRAIRKHIAQLLKYSEIKCIEIDRFQCKKKYKNLSRRMLLYYV